MSVGKRKIAPQLRCDAIFRFAESEGFEPPNPFGSTVFKTAAINHSANSPSHKGLQI